MSIENIIANISNKDFISAKKEIENAIQNIVEQKLFEKKKYLASTFSESEEIEKFDYDRKRFKDDHDKAEETENSYRALINKEMHSVTHGISRDGTKTARGREHIYDYKDRKEEYFNKAGRKAVNTHGTNVDDAAKHLHKLVSGVENKHEPWMHSLGHDWDDLHPQVKNDLKNHIKREISQREDAKDPEKLARMQRRGAKIMAAKAEFKQTELAKRKALSDFKSKQSGKSVPEKSKEPMSKQINDEIPHLEESKKEPDRENIKKRVAKDAEKIEKHRKGKKKVQAKYKKQRGKTFRQDVDDLARKYATIRKEKK